MKEVKFLGVISFVPLVKMLKVKCTKALDVIKVVAHSKWGAVKITLLHLYRSLVRSKLHYGFIIFGSARSSYIKALDAIHHQGIRLMSWCLSNLPGR